MYFFTSNCIKLQKNLQLIPSASLLNLNFINPIKPREHWYYISLETNFI